MASLGDTQVRGSRVSIGYYSATKECVPMFSDLVVSGERRYWLLAGGDRIFRSSGLVSGRPGVYARNWQPEYEAQIKKFQSTFTVAVDRGAKVDHVKFRLRQLERNLYSSSTRNLEKISACLDAIAEEGGW
jgi:hypothetical protein